MNRILLFCALGALWGCRTVNEPTTDEITLSYSTSQESKVGSLTVGDEVAVFGRVEGTEDYFLEAAKYGVGSDGQSLTYGSTVYYPETKQAVNFYAYFPYHTGSFSVPSDQSTAAALKQADLCWANTSTTPVSTPIALEFKHMMARLIVQTNSVSSKIVFPNALSGGTLNVQTGVLITSIKDNLLTTGTELILPAQSLTRLILTVANIDYVFDDSITLQAGKTTTLNLKLNPSTQTAALNGSSTTNWMSSSQSGDIEQNVSNTLTLHWPKCHPKSSSVNKVILTIKDPTNGTTINDTVSNGISYANQTFTVPFVSATLHYPYIIEYIALYQSNTWIHESTTIIGGTVVKSGDCVVGVKQPLNPPAPTDYVKIGSIYWAKGNLVAVSKNNNYECKVGAPADGGLYFQFGSLIGWKGGNQVNGGTGVGIPQAPLTTNGTYWNGSGYSWTADAMVWPSEMTSNPSAWPSNNGSSAGDRNTVVDQWFFNYNTAPYSTAEQDIRGFSNSFAGDKGTGNLGTGRYAKWGIGDPCSYYLGGTWRLPTSAEIVALCNNQKPGYGTNVAWSSCGASWTTSPVAGGNFYSNQLFFPASGSRYNSNGSFYNVTTYGYYWSSSVCDATLGLSLLFISSWVYSQNNNVRSNGFPVRCVADRV